MRLGIRSSIEKRSDGQIFESDIIDVLNHHNKLFVTKISGNTILAALERSAAIRHEDSNGGFLQMSGVHVTYDYNQPKGQYVVSAEVRCAVCDVPDYEPLVKEQIYSVIVPEFLLEGGDGHKFVESNNSENVTMQLKDREALIAYIKARDFVYPGIEERITIIEKSSNGGGEGGSGGGGDGAISVTSSLVLIVMSLATWAVAH